VICVFDSSVWVSAFHFGGTPLIALKTAHSLHRIAICESIRDEVRSALQGKFRWPSNRIEEAMDEFRPRILDVGTPGRLHGVCRDPNDDMVLECAALAHADVIVSGDKDLLALGEYEGILVLTPRAFLDEFARPAEA
jgi:putative PIN family toxin of toxin-antitoxin system